MSIPEILNQLTDRFRDNIDAYKSSGYNEARLRGEFINPFFEALGWDIYNKQGYAEAYKDVIHEDAIKVGGATKAPDYSFRIGGVRKFFLETKKPSVNIKDDPEPAFQLRRYAWSAKLPLSILTDFEEFAVYDCRIKPSANDKPSTGRIMYFTYKEYSEKWEAITSVFSREAILKGSFDRFVESEKKKRGTAEVDDAFLKEIESWRDALARNIALRNSALTERDINYAVQLTIDRIIFLRICEDRGIEDYGRLQALLNGEHVYRRMVGLYYRADEKYNSGLFHFQSERGRPGEPDELTPDLKIDDKVLKDIIKGLYYPESPYEFSVLPVDILGHVYERFLGKVIRLTAGGRAKIEEKPEVRKAGGVYYTPKYIVDYIVENTVGRLLWGDVENRKSERGNRKEQLTPVKASKLRILDPACGSGSFLIGAYEYLLDWHRDWYVENDPLKHTKQIYRGAGDQWYLTTAEKKRILLNNIYGVDIDAQAVEVTKLNLLLKALEGESGETIESQLKMFRERALPDLRGNIKCGNSLIGPDFYDGKQLDLLDDEERYRINAFDWEREFPEVFKHDGFDVVIGNPPYVRMEGFKDVKEYLKQKYSCHDERSDIYSYFIEKGHLLLKMNARFGMIVSNKFARSNYGSPLRKFLLENSSLESITDFAGLPIFKGATVRTLVLITSRKQNPGISQTVYSPPPPSHEFSLIEGGSKSVEDIIKHHSYLTNLEQNIGQGWGFSNEKYSRIMSKFVDVGISLKRYCDGKIYRGVVSGLTNAFVISNELRSTILKKNKKAKEIIKPLLNGRNVRRYYIDYDELYLIYCYHGIDIDKYPAIKKHLENYKDRLKKRATNQNWYELQQPQYRFVEYFEKPKIIFPDIATESRFAFDETGYYGTNTTYFIPMQDLYLLGILNSKLGRFYFKQVCAGLEGGGTTYLRFFGQYLEGFPVRTIDKDNPHEKSRHDQVVSLVEKMLELHKQLAAAKSAHENTVIQRQIDATDKQIDELVYELYGITEEERQIIEGDTV